MPKSPVRVQHWWSEAVQSWFQRELSRADLETNRRARLVRLASDPQMRPVALTLVKKEPVDPHFPDPVVEFLLAAWEAPDRWKLLKDQPVVDKGAEQREFGRVSRQFVIALEAQRDMVIRLYLDHDGMEEREVDQDGIEWAVGGEPLFVGYDPENGEPSINPKRLKPAQKRFTALLDTIGDIANAAENGVYYFPSVQIDIPKKRRYKEAETVFCIQFLLRSAHNNFGKWLLDEVATTVTVLLGSEHEPVALERVKSIKKHLKKGADYSGIP